MTARWRYIWVLFVILSTVLMSNTITAETTVLSKGGSPDSPVRQALLIGISQYQNPQLPILPGSKNDIEVIQQVLISRFGFYQEHIKVLIDHAATRKAILRTLRKIVRDARPNDFLYIHYSGHGSQVKDLNGDEHDDQLDETLVPFDGRSDGIPDITDDELEHIFSKLRTEGAVIVLDSCHSGTATRGLEVRTRSIPRDTRLDLYQNLVPHSRGIVPLFSERYVLMTSAASHEQTLDAMVNGRDHGLFTYSLFRTLQTIALPATNREVFQKTQTRLRRMNVQLSQRHMPQPQLEAPTHRLDEPIFPFDTFPLNQDTRVRQNSSKSWASVQPIEGDRVLLDIKDKAGRLPGSVWGLYMPGEPIYSQNASAYATVVATYPHGSVGEVNPPGIVIPEGTQAIFDCSASIHTKSHGTSIGCPQ